MRSINNMNYNYYVAFIDVLGTKNKLDDSEGVDEVFNQLNKIYDLIEYEKKEYIKDIYPSKIEITIRTFSDNYFLAIKDDNKNSNLSGLIRIVGRIVSRSILEYGILLRGAITYGQMIIKENIIIGEALVNAYLLESTTAIYPRIILSDKVNYKFLVNNNLYYGSIIFKDFDGVYCVNSLVFRNGGQETKQLFTFLNKALEKYNNVDKIGIKYKWFVTYLNNFYSEKYHKSRYPKGLKDIYKKYNL